MSSLQTITVCRDFVGLLTTSPDGKARIVSIVRLSDQNALATRAQAAFARIHDVELAELSRLMKYKPTTVLVSD